VAPPKSAPNVLLVLYDDEGFGASSTFGGMIPMPYQDAIAKEGLIYNNFHTTSLCSPTRAALITGRNHHDVGFGVISEISTGFPGYDSVIGKQHATIGRILQANGYATAWFGKDHNVPGWESTNAGPFDQWPTGQGFDYFYGFLGGDTDQWNPSIYENTSLQFPSVGHPGYNLNIDLANRAIDWLKRTNDMKPQQPVFLYYAPGATHAPHQPTAEWINKFKGKFDYGWNAYREYTFKRQVERGIIPKAAKLTPWPKDLLPDWDSLSPLEKNLYARQMEVYAAYLAVKSSLQSVNLTPRQKLEIKPMVQNYQTQTVNATPDQKKAAGKTLLENIYGVLTPAQQTQFKVSMKSAMMQSH
jgi:arylsulfatase